MACPAVGLFGRISKVAMQLAVSLDVDGFVGAALAQTEFGELEEPPEKIGRKAADEGAKGFLILAAVNQMQCSIDFSVAWCAVLDEPAMCQHKLFLNQRQQCQERWRGRGREAFAKHGSQDALTNALATILVRKQLLEPRVEPLLLHLLFLLQLFLLRG